MSKTETLQGRPQLTPEERLEVRQRLAELGQGDWLDAGVPTSREKTLIEERFRDLEAHPRTSIPWEKARRPLPAPSKR